MVDFKILFGGDEAGAMRSVYEHDGPLDSVGLILGRPSFMKSFGVADVRISYAGVPGDSGGMLNTFTVEENFKVFLSIKVKLLLSDELEYKSFLEPSALNLI